VLGPSGLRRTRGGKQRRWSSSLQCHSDEEKTGERESASQGGVTRRPNPKRRGERSSRTQRTTTRWKASWFLRKRSPSREAWERRPRPARQAKHHCLSKGAAACGAAGESPILSQQRVGDKGCSAGTSRRGAHAMREPFTRLRRPRKVPAAGLAGSRKMRSPE
jgi:hypothetical protein